MAGASGDRVNEVSVLTSVTNGLQRVMTELYRDQRGQGLVEYSLILLFIALVAIAALTFLGSDISSALSSIGRNL
jgi:pilus assembly protein Flp/PilA